MNEEIYYNGEEVRNANNDSKETENAISEGIGEVTAINSNIAAFWTDENGKQMVEELANQINDSKDFNENYTKYLQVIIEATETLGEKGEQIRLDLSKAKDISNSIEIVGDNVQNVRESLNSAAGSAKEFSGEISSIAINVTKVLYLLATIDKDITKIFAELAENENIVEPKLNNILANMQVSSNEPVIDFNKVSTSIDNSKNGIFVNVNDKQRENYWKDCTLEETKEPGVYRASKDGIILGFVQLTEAGMDYEYIKQNEEKEEVKEKIENPIVQEVEELEVNDGVTVIDISKSENRIAQEQQEKGVSKNQEQHEQKSAKNLEDKLNEKTQVIDATKSGNKIAEEQRERGLESLGLPKGKQYKYSESNAIAKMAEERGWTQNQIDIAVGISRHETGDYSDYKAQDYYNYGGLRKGKGVETVGTSKGGFALFGSQEDGINSFLNTLEGYFENGNTTPESIVSKYAPASDGNNQSNWINAVYGSMN